MSDRSSLLPAGLERSVVRVGQGGAPYFPSPESVELAQGVREVRYNRGDVGVILTFVPPAAEHTVTVDEATIAMVLRGRVAIRSGDSVQRLEAEKQSFLAGPGVSYAVVNDEPGEALLVAVTYSGDRADVPGADLHVLDPFESRKFVGMDVTFFVADWIELMLADIPGGGSMPYHSHAHQQIGVCLEGVYEMFVEGTVHELDVAGAYFCQAHEGHGASNPHEPLARSLNIFIPPRYHRVAGRSTV